MNGNYVEVDTGVYNCDEYRRVCDITDKCKDFVDNNPLLSRDDIEIGLYKLRCQGRYKPSLLDNAVKNVDYWRYYWDDVVKQLLEEGKMFERLRIKYQREAAVRAKSDWCDGAEERRQEEVYADRRRADYAAKKAARYEGPYVARRYIPPPPLTDQELCDAADEMIRARNFKTMFAAEVAEAKKQTLADKAKIAAAISEGYEYCGGKICVPAGGLKRKRR